MEKLKIGKHDHTLTDILKIAIFSIVMLAPFFSIGTKCLYVVCNKNAKDSYYGETINEIEYKNISYDNLTQNNNYVLTNTLLSTLETTSQTTMTISNLNILSPQVNFDYTNATQMRFYVNSEGIPRIYLYNTNNQAIGSPFDLNSVLINFEFTYLGYTNQSYNTTLLNLLNFKYKTYNNYSYMDNVFYYAVDQINNQELFNWTKNTALYIPINAMLADLSAGSSNPMATLLTYWAFMTMIYIVFDIIIFIFTKITHLLQN